jgi:hypothetical protein
VFEKNFIGGGFFRIDYGLADVRQKRQSRENICQGLMAR